VNFKTVKLRNGMTVLAHDAGPYTYANRTQAVRSAERLNNGTYVKWDVWRGTGRPFYVRMVKV